MKKVIWGIKGTNVGTVERRLSHQQHWKAIVLYTAVWKNMSAWHAGTNILKDHTLKDTKKLIWVKNINAANVEWSSFTKVVLNATAWFTKNSKQNNYTALEHDIGQMWHISPEELIYMIQHWMYHCHCLHMSSYVNTCIFIVAFWQIEAQTKWSSGCV